MALSRVTRMAKQKGVAAHVQRTSDLDVRLRILVSRRFTQITNERRPSEWEMHAKQHYFWYSVGLSFIGRSDLSSSYSARQWTKLN